MVKKQNSESKNEKKEFKKRKLLTDILDPRTTTTTTSICNVLKDLTSIWPDVDDDDSVSCLPDWLKFCIWKNFAVFRNNLFSDHCFCQNNYVIMIIFNFSFKIYNKSLTDKKIMPKQTD